MFKISPRDIFYLILYSIPNTIFSFGILFIINNVISGNPEFLTDYMGMVFVAVVIYTYLLNIVFQKKLNEYSFAILYRNEKSIFDKILKTPLLTLEKLGSQRFYTAVEDLRLFSFLPETVTHTINSLLMLLLCMGYLFTISISSAMVIIVMIVLLAGMYFLVINTMSKQVAELREYNEHYFQYVNDVTGGFKELAISKLRRSNLMKKFLAPNRDNAEKLAFNISYIFLSINLISQYGLYLVIGIALFLLPQVGLLAQEDVISYVVILLFISGPVNNLINMQNIYTRFSVANQRINRFLQDFAGEEIDLSAPALPSPIDFESLQFKNVRFTYANDQEEEQFTMGPINLEIKKGETIFVVGGNGSGKSTFIKTLTGLYKPTDGEMLLNGESNAQYKDQLQVLLSAIFTDNHLFSHNYDGYVLENNGRYRDLLETMHLGEVVVDDKEESARRNFSKGQSKRMSMIFALLESKPVLVLDEWAADQDPHFRKYFYENLLPKLKAQGKTIIAVTHDDAYFKHADRIIKFDYGQIVQDVRVADKVLNVESLWYNQ